MKKILTNACHWQSSLLGVAVIAGGFIALYTGKIDAVGFGVVCTVAAFPILGIGKKKEDAN